MEANENRLVLRNRNDIDNAQELRDTLITLVKQGKGDVIVVGQAVELIDVATLQVLWSAMKTLKNRGRKLKFSDISPALQRVMEESGLEKNENDQLIP